MSENGAGFGNGQSSGHPWWWLHCLAAHQGHVMQHTKDVWCSTPRTCDTAHQGRVMQHTKDYDAAHQGHVMQHTKDVWCSTPRTCDAAHQGRVKQHTKDVWCSTLRGNDFGKPVSHNSSFRTVQIVIKKVQHSSYCHEPTDSRTSRGSQKVMPPAIFILMGLYSVDRQPTTNLHCIKSDQS